MNKLRDNWRARRSDLFVRAQSQLMWLYSGLLILFLILFISVSYSFFEKMVSNDQLKQLKRAATAQKTYMTTVLADQTIDANEGGRLRAYRRVEGLFFYYIADANGKLIFREEPYERKQTELLNVLKNWKPTTYQTSSVNVNLDFTEVEDSSSTRSLESSDDPDNDEEIVQPTLDIDTENANYHLLLSAQPIYKGEQFIGMLYMGKDITASLKLFLSLLKVLIVLGLAFVIIVFPLSYWMSRRAMKPIKSSYIRQREFVADASHELRTPLSILHSSLDVVEEENGETLTPFSKRVVGDMRDEVRRMTKLVGDLLTLARADSGQPQLQKAPYDLIPSLDQVMRNAQTLAQAKAIKVELIAPSKLDLVADRERIEQLMYILLENAIKYTPNEGHISFEITVDDYLRLPMVEIKVTDSGLGIPKDELARIFERFYRVDKHRAKQLGGTGLGLSIAKWIVDAHEGTIKVNSEVGKGTTFTVQIPIEEQ